MDRIDEIEAVCERIKELGEGKTFDNSPHTLLRESLLLDHVPYLITEVRVRDCMIRKIAGLAVSHGIDLGKVEKECRDALV